MDAALAGNLEPGGLPRPHRPVAREPAERPGRRACRPSQASAAYLRTSGGNSLLTAAVPRPAAAASGSDTVVTTDSGDTEIYNLGGVATWEPDFFGGKTRAVEGAKARQEAARLDLESRQGEPHRRGGRRLRQPARGCRTRLALQTARTPRLRG